MADKKIVMMDSPEAASLQTRQVWVDSRGGVHLDEHHARWCGATHQKCDTCDEIIEVRSFCRACSDANRKAEWEAMPIVEWDGQSMLVLFDDDKYFNDLDEAIEWAEENEVEPKDLQLVQCVPNGWRELDADYWSDELPEDGELPGPIEDAVAEFNAKLKAYGRPCSWSPGKQRVIVEAEPTERERYCEGEIQ